ncbi:MAG: hypothetical protein KGS72_03825 [Cyanobacteria bacterium REEB67]|nr:hypothetical protein [Cyanobacteria bacterium REEB67]
MPFSRLSSASCLTAPSLVACARDGEITNLELVEASDNSAFDMIVLSTVKSMAHDPVLQFPVGTPPLFVEKSGTFVFDPLDAYASGRPAHERQGRPEVR